MSGPHCTDRTKKSKKVERLLSDNDTEFLSLKRGLNMVGAMLTTSSAYMPESNGLAKQINKTILSKVRDMIGEASLHGCFREETLTLAADIHNQTATPVLNMNLPIRMLMGNAPDSSKLRNFGCAAYVHKHKEHRARKLDDGADKNLYMATRYGLYRIYMPRNKAVVTSKHVSFDGLKCPFKRVQDNLYEVGDIGVLNKTKLINHPHQSTYDQRQEPLQQALQPSDEVNNIIYSSK